MRKLNIFAILMSVLILASCGKESPFDGLISDGEGIFSKDALLLDVRDDMVTGAEKIATRGQELDDFKIIFTKVGSTTPEVTFTYKEMPDVVTLRTGKYTVTATLGHDVEADWESPYYLGVSGEFEVRKGEITSDIDPIVCRLQNVKVSVFFDDDLTAAMSDDSYVEVKVGDNAGIKFRKEHEGTAAHFRHEDGVSLVATFHGNVEDVETVETKSYDKVNKGYHYRLTFRLHSASGDSKGDAAADVNVDASVTVTNLENNIVIEDETDLGDEERPRENPDTPEVPDEDMIPEVTMISPTSLVFGQPYNVTANDIEKGISLKIVCNPGITRLDIDIISNTLNADELERAGLSSHLDMVNPGELDVPLTGLGFETNVGGKTEIIFKIPANLMNLLNMVGAGDTHTFRITVANELCKDEPVVKEMILKL